MRELEGKWPRRLLAGLDAHPVKSVALLRVLLQTLPALNYTLALSGLKFRNYLIGTLIGLPLAIPMFTVGWTFQFVGHAFEGKKPSFFEDIQYLWVGPLFVLSKLLARLGLQRAVGAEWVEAVFAEHRGMQYTRELAFSTVVDLMAQGQLLPYLDIPFQHASPRVLGLMKRPAHSENTLERIRQWREVCPQLVIRSTFVVGFPGETEEDFEYLLDWLRQAQLDRVGCFTYSAIEGAAANDLPDPVPEAVKESRKARLMALQQDISAARLQARVGQVLTVLVDELDHEDGVVIARSIADAPEIDGHVYVDGLDTQQVQTGQFLQVLVDEANEYDLFGSPVSGA